jgi:phosphoglycolate phosphatase-like HAD superfamily hydrolase
MKSYSNYIFDCDGVILDSNGIKGEAFYQIAYQFSPSVAEEFLAYHYLNGGLNRIKKLEYLFRELLRLPDPETEIQKSLEVFQRLTLRRLKDCKIVPGFETFNSALPSSAKKWVVSAGLQQDLDEVLGHKGLSRFFHGIFGAPGTKIEHIHRLNLEAAQTIFFGDSKLDYDVSSHF